MHPLSRRMASLFIAMVVGGSLDTFPGFNQITSDGRISAEDFPHIRQTPTFVSRIGALREADSESASTSRDFAGSMMPSSQSRADE